MRRILYLLSFFIAVPLFAGVTYKFESKSSGGQEARITGRVEADGNHMRMDIEHGDPVLFKDKSIIISNDGGKTMAIVDPAAKTYYVVDLDEFLGNSMSALKDAGGNLKFENPKIDVRDGGAGPTMLGYPTRKTTIDAVYDMIIELMGNKLASRIKTHTDIWRTEKLPTIVTPFQMKGIRTGMPAFDKLIDAYDKNVKGFAIREETVVETTMAGHTNKVTQSTNISDLQVRDVAASDFVVPAGYAKTPSPIEQMLRSLKN